MKVNRRDLLKKAGLGSLVLASLPKLGDALATPVWAQTPGVLNYHIATQSFAGPPGTPAAPQDRIQIYGQGAFRSSGLTGGGGWNHVKFPGANPPKGGPPLPIVAGGAWQAKQFISFNELGRYGVVVAGVLEMVVDLLREIPSPATIRGARLKVICNIGFAGLQTGQEEGIVLSIPGTSFFTGEKPGPFEPIPMVGLTAFTSVALQ